MTKVQKRIQEAYAACYRLCESDRYAEQWLTKSLDAARRGEMAHRKTGSRFLQLSHHCMYKLPVADAARFFAVKWFLDTVKAPKHFADACGLREDTLYAYGARDQLCESSESKYQAWRGLQREFTDVAGLDYSEVFAA